MDRNEIGKIVFRPNFDELVIRIGSFSYKWNRTQIESGMILAKTH